MENPAQKSYQLYIDGQWVDASDGGTLDVFCPANGEQLSTIADATKEDVDRAVDAAVSYTHLLRWKGNRQGDCQENRL